MKTPVLDVTSGGRMMWFDKADPRVIFTDRRTIEVEAAPTPDAPALWRDSDREDWKREGPIRLELVAAPYVTAGISRGGSVLIDDDSETVAVDEEHLPALIAMLTEVQRRIEAGDAA